MEDVAGAIDCITRLVCTGLGTEKNVVGLETLTRNTGAIEGAGVSDEVGDYMGLAQGVERLALARGLPVVGSPGPPNQKG